MNKFLKSFLNKFKFTIIIFTLSTLIYNYSLATTYLEAENYYLQGSYKNSINILKILNEQGNQQSETLTGIMYLKGEGFTANPYIASIWFYKASRKGDHNAQLVLGTQYLYGIGVEKDIFKAYTWLTLSSKSSEVNVSNQAKKFLDLALKQLSKKDLNRANLKIKKWKPIKNKYKY